MPTVLIAAPASLESLKERSEFRDALAFSDVDALRAFEAIVRHRTATVVVESGFASTCRGTAFVNRIQADPLLADCEVRVLAVEETPPARLGPAEMTAPEPAPAPEPSSRPQHAATPLPPPEPARATPTAGGLDVLIDGNSATLVELSTAGVEVLSVTILRPQQRVRLTLPGSTTMQVSGEISWAMFEMPAGGPRYRAAITLAAADIPKIAAFVESSRS